MAGKRGMRWNREPVPYMLAVAHMLRRIEAVPCREAVPLVVLTEKPVERVPEPKPPVPLALPLRPGESVIRSVVSGQWVIVKLARP